MRHLTAIDCKAVRFCGLLVMLISLAACGTPPKAGYKFTKSTQPPRDSPRFHNKKYLEHLPPGFQVPDETDELGWRILAAYGAAYVAQSGVTPPPVVRFSSPEETAAWQAQVSIERFEFGEKQYGNAIELQSAAMQAFKESRQEAEEMGLSLTPKGPDSARRGYNETIALWQSRVARGLDHWVALSRLSEREAARLKALPPMEQVMEIMRLEGQGTYFSKDYTQSIFSTVAAPGASQHLSLLALDLYEYENYDIRLILARHGWYQTIPSDLPHFTFLGVPQKKLPELGLKRVINSERAFWVPDVQ